MKEAYEWRGRLYIYDEDHSDVMTFFGDNTRKSTSRFIKITSGDVILVVGEPTHRPYVRGAELIPVLFGDYVGFVYKEVFTRKNGFDVGFREVV